VPSKICVHQSRNKGQANACPYYLQSKFMLIKPEHCLLYLKPMSSIQNFINQLSSFNQISSDFEEFLRTSLHDCKHQKNHILLDVGQIPKELWYLASGTARVFSRDRQSQMENTLWFWQTGDIILPFSGFYLQLPSKTCIKLTEKSQVISISFVHLKYLSVLFPEYHIIAQKLLESLITNLTSHLEMIKNNSTKQRYQTLLKTRPDLFNHAAIKEMASFLGMSINTMKHIRSIRF